MARSSRGSLGEDARGRAAASSSAAIHPEDADGLDAVSAADTAQVLVVVTAAVPLVACTVCRCTFLDGRDQRYVMTVQYGDDAA